METAKENWIDHIKIFACILVALGHFFQSMCTSGVLSPGPIYQWFNQTIYYFHVPLFFICSGYLYQKYGKVHSFAEWKHHILKKLLSLGVPYIVFSLVTWVMKRVFSGEVNLQANSLWRDLFVHPMSPYWYLFVLLFVFLITWTFFGKRGCCIGIAIALLLKVAAGFVDCYVVKIVLENQIWFVLGMAVCFCDFSSIAKKRVLWSGVLAGAFMLLSLIKWPAGIKGTASFVMGLLACGAVLLIFCEKSRKRCALSEYTLPVFLMHTICAAGARVVLMKMGITAPVIHVVIGLLATFGGPIIAAEIMKRLKLDILYQPRKYIKLKCCQGVKNGEKT